MESKAVPVQERSRQTRESILAAALSMYEKKGYHSTTVDEIAAQAGVSTGIAYRYFKNKKDILLNAIAYGAENVGSIAGISTSLPEDIGDVRGHITAVLKAFEDFHEKYRDIHEELEGLQHTDNDVRLLYSKITEEKMKGVAAGLGRLLGNDCHIRERAYAAIGIMEQHCHTCMNSGIHGLDTDVMREMAAEAVLCILKGADNEG